MCVCVCVTTHDMYISFSHFNQLIFPTLRYSNLHSKYLVFIALVFERLVSKALMFKLVTSRLFTLEAIPSFLNHTKKILDNSTMH